MGPGAVSAPHTCVPGVLPCYSQLAAGRHCSTQPHLLNFVPSLEKCLLSVLKEGTSAAGCAHGVTWAGHCSQRGPEGQGCPAQCQPRPGRSTSLSQGPCASPALRKAGTPGHRGKHQQMDLKACVLSPGVLLARPVGQCLHLSEPRVGGSSHLQD